MKEITFNNKKYNIPTEWQDVNVGMAIKAGELSDVLPDTPFISILAGYSGIPVKELTTSKLEDIQEIVKLLDFIYEDYKPVPRFEFEFKGEKYSAPMDLVEQQFGDFVSIQTILYNNKEMPVKGLARIIAVMCKKDGESIDTIDVNAREELFKELPITIARDVEGFFLGILKAYNISFRLSSVVEEMEKSILLQLKELKDIMKLRKEQSGGFSLTRLWIGYFQIYLWYFQKLLEKYFNSTRTKHSKENWKMIYRKLFITPLNRKQRSKKKVKSKLL